MPRKNKKGNRKRKQHIPKLLSLGPTYPQSLIGRHKYVEQLELTANYTLTNSIPATAFTYFGANTLYDPNRAVGGHQAMFYDQMEAIYRDYVVLGSKIKVRFINTSAEPLFIHVNRRNSVMNTDHTTADLEETQPTNKMTILPVASSGQPSKTLTQSYSPAKQFGISKKQVRNNEELILGSGENVPGVGKEVYYNIAMQQIGASLGGNNNATCKILVEVEYTALWSNRKDTMGAS